MASSSPPAQRVLVIDDDPVLREVLQALLAADGHTVETAGSGEEALHRLQSDVAVDVLLADVQLPGLAGAALARALRAAVPGARLLGMSGSEPTPDVRGAFEAFLLKPFSPEDFAAAAGSGKGVEAAADEDVIPAASGAVTLDEAIFGRLAATLPAAHLEQLYQLTAADVAARVSRMGEAEAGGDLPLYRQEAHALKGGCSMVGALELAQLAARAETAEALFGVDTPTIVAFERAAERLATTIAAHIMHNT